MDEKKFRSNVEQVHISLGSKSGTVIISYATTSLLFASSYVHYSKNPASLQSDNSDDVLTAVGSSRVYSSLISVNRNLLHPVMGSANADSANIVDMQNTASWAFDPVTKEHYGNWAMHTDVVYGPMAYNNPRGIYDSPVLHTVILENLTSGITYYYRPKGSDKVFSFIAPYRANSIAELSFPFTFALLADLGQTRVSEASLAAVAALRPDVTLLAGDLAYADGWPLLWDSFGRMIQSVFAFSPLLTTGGNHEMGSAEGWQHYEARFPPPHADTGCRSSYWGIPVGPAHVIALNSYARTAKDSHQYTWLVDQLANAVDRSLTPWLIVMMHVPWYSTNSGHWREAESMRTDMEDVLFEYGVDLIIAGHNHAYERTVPMYRGEPDPCGPVHVTVGDGGNYESVLVPWRTPKETWSSFREASFGVSGLTLHNVSHAYLSWHRHACASDTADEHFVFSDSCASPGDNSVHHMSTSDESWLVRPETAHCRNRQLRASRAQGNVRRSS